MSNSKEVFQLRKNKQLGDAYELAIKLYNQDPNDEWIQKAYAWVLIDIVKIEIHNDINKAQSFFNQLQSINFVEKDKILLKQINFLKPKLNINYQEILKAENFSKNGNHQEALNIFRNMYRNGKLSQDNQESYGWAVYRYLKEMHNNIDINEVKRILFEYLNLQNHKPSLLHSVILQFSLFYSKNQNFNFYRFFELWNPIYLREEDKEKQYKDGKTYPSLVEKIIKLLVDKNYQIDIDYLKKTINDDKLVIETIRETYFWKIFNLHKNNNFQELWNLFNFYVDNFSNLGNSHWHSEILKLANRFMIDENSWRFFNFFQKWNYNNLRYDDWEEEINGDNRYKSLARKSLSIVFKHIKSNIKSNNIDNNNLQWALELYHIALDKEKNDIWLLREYAILLKITNSNDKAIAIYKNIILDLSDQAYIWHEFSKLLEEININISISMLCKAISIQKNEDFLDQIHLDLAKLLINSNRLKEAKIELKQYEKHRIKKEWKLSEEFVLLNKKVENIETNDINKNFYKENIALAEDYIYSEIEWTNLLLYDNWKTKDNKERVIFTDLNDIELAINPYKFSLLRNSKKDEVYQVKLHYDKSNDKYIALQIRESSLEKNDLIDNASKGIAIVDHINNDKKLFHYVVDNSSDGIIRFNQTKLRPNIGDFIEIIYFKTFNKSKKEYKTHILDITKTDKTNSSLLKVISGRLSLKVKYQDDYDPSYDTADFGFIDDYYVPKYLLNKYNITEDCNVEAKILFNPKEKNFKKQWKVFEFTVIRN
jgi:hypothetical protein